MNERRRGREPQGAAAAHSRSRDHRQGGQPSPGDVGIRNRAPRGSPVTATATRTASAAAAGPSTRTANFRLPPKIESMLESWHERAHTTDAAAEPTTV